MKIMLGWRISLLTKHSHGSIIARAMTVPPSLHRECSFHRYRISLNFLSARLVWSVLFFSLILFSSYVSGQSNVNNQSLLFQEGWRWTQFTVESGLPSNDIRAITETEDGTPWVATGSGIAWYDGYRWNIIDSTKGLPRGVPRVLNPARRDSIFLVIGQRLYHGGKLGFCDITPANCDLRVSWDKHIFIWSDTAFTLFMRGSAVRIPRPNAPISPLLIESELWVAGVGEVWLNTRSGLQQWENERWRVAMKADPDEFRINYLSMDDSGRGVASIGKPLKLRGLWEWKHNAPPVKNTRDNLDIINLMTTSADGDILVINNSGDVALRHKLQWHTVDPIPPQMRNAEQIHFRQNGDLWVGTQRGLFLYDRHSARWTYRRQQSSVRNRIHEIIRTRDGSQWFGTADGLEIYKPDGTHNTITSILSQPLFEVTGIVEDTEGNVWISSGSSFDGAFRWDGHGWKHFAVNDMIPSLKFHKIFKDREGRLWFVGMASQTINSSACASGVAVYEHGRFSSWGADEPVLRGRVYTFAEGVDGALWFGSTAGLCRWREGAWTRWPNNAESRMKGIFTTAIDRENNIWFADRAYGLAKIDTRDSVTYYDKESGLPDMTIRDIKIDSASRLWVSTDNGVGCLDHGGWLRYDVASGLPINSTWPILPLGDTVLIGTVGAGVAILNLRECSNEPPRIEIERPATEGRNVILRWHSFAYWGEPSTDEIISRYRIGDGVWSHWSTTHNLTLLDLDPGDYSFQVQAQNVFGQFDVLGDRRSFSIAPPFFMSPSFIIPVGSSSVAAIIFGSLYIARRRRHTIALRSYHVQLRSLAIELSATEERERRRIATYLHDTMGQTLALCKIKLEALQYPTAQKDMEEVTGEIERLIEQTQSLTFELSPPILYEFGLVDALEWLAGRMHKEYGVRVTIEDDQSPTPLSEEMRAFLFHIIRELLINTIKHARATTASVLFSKEGQFINISVEDNGVGFSLKAGNGAIDQKGGFGLFNIRERITHLGGTVTIDSSPGFGTRVLLRIPFENMKNNSAEPSQ